jgi:hypothetical protein
MLPKYIGNSPVITGGIRNLIARFGIEVYLYAENQEEFDTTITPEPTDTYNEVYGIFSGTKKDLTATTIRVLLPAQAYTVTDEFFVSDIDTVDCWTLEALHNGDVIQIPREDSKILKYKIVAPRTIGFEKVLITTFRITPLGD